MNRIYSAVGAACVLAVAAMPAAASEAKKEQAEYLAFLKMLPGDYDNLTQADDSAGQVQPLIYSIRPLDLQLVGKLVMLVRETAANDPKRLLGEHIWMITRDEKKNTIVQHVYQFKEPQRWLHAGDDPLLMQSLLPDDLQQMGGCEIYWTKSVTGFSGATRPHVCRPAASEEGHLIEMGAELTEDGLTLTEVQAGAGGRLPTDSSTATAVHLQRRGS